ncbi:glucokinase [Parapusillimonas granuli]|uniref:Glucokinase n=1 Tax=Parapusillimonas granuli TaxID=380911 RepID=A0A853FUP8_9BURK|nr:glucokinase [Parapusillimonas granuli]MBB5213630.1 glucokinase [Parapusillimonas granuli]NYT48468.1 glucokinase [Parapusillimonas granuli]
MFTGTHDRPQHLIADIGGTNARFALCSGPASVARIAAWPVNHFSSLREAIEHYLDECGRPEIAGAVIGIANPVLGDRIQMTNFNWSFSIEDLRRKLRLDALHVINDFTALALALPHLAENELRRVGGGASAPRTPLGVIGPGTGLGVSALIPTPHGPWLPLAAEGGHVSFAACNDLEQRLWEHARAEFGHVSMERLLSGAGLQFIHRCLSLEQGLQPQALGPADISFLAISDKDPTCRRALDAFCAILGTAASDLAVTLGARGGIYLGGGIIPKLGEYFLTSPFRARFNDKGRFSDYLSAIPVFIIDAAYPGLTGAAAYLERLEHDQITAGTDSARPGHAQRGGAQSRPAAARPDA